MGFLPLLKWMGPSDGGCRWNVRRDSRFGANHELSDKRHTRRLTGKRRRVPFWEWLCDARVGTRFSVLGCHRAIAAALAQP